MGTYGNWYTSQNYDRLSIFLPKGSREKIKAEAKKKGLSINEFVRSFLPNELFSERIYKGKRETRNDYSGNNGKV